MPLFLKALDPTIDILGNEQTFKYNADQLNNEANLILQNLFTPLVNTNLNTGLAFVNSNLNGFRFKHEFTTSSAIFGNFYLECASRFGGSSSNIFKYDELTDSLVFYKNIFLTNLSITGNLSLNSNKITDLANGTVNTDAINLGQLNSAITGLGFSALNNGFFVKTASNTYVNRNITVSSNLTISNSDGVSGNPLINLASNITTNSFTTTGGDVNATTGTLKGNNLSVHNSSSIGVLTSLNMNSNYINFLPTPINNQDAATKQFVLDNAGGVAKSILQGFNNATYSTNVNVGDHIKFDGVAFVRGSNISLDTTSTYTTSTGVASVGRITLAAGKTYKLVGSLNNATSSGGGDYNAARWYNADNGAVLGLISGASPPNSTTNRVPGAGVIAYITTSVATRVELRITFNALSSVNGTADAIGTAWFTVEEV